MEILNLNHDVRQFFNTLLVTLASCMMTLSMIAQALGKNENPVGGPYCHRWSIVSDFYIVYNNKQH